MRNLVLFAIIGFFAQLIDGSLGMAYGATSSSLLLMFGVAPAIASASIHMAEITTTAASGVSHIWFKNVDKRLVLKLIIPGSISAFVGAAFLSNLPGAIMRPFISFFLMLLGFYILVRFLIKNPSQRQVSAKISSKFLTPIGLLGGFFDAIGGGGWGPIITPVLLSREGMTPRKVIGSVDTSEFAVAVSATLGFILFLGWQQFTWQWVFAFMIGGIAAAPLAAWLVKIIPSYILGVLVGGFIILTNLSTLLHSADLIPDKWSGGAYVILILLWGCSIYYQVRKVRNRNTIAQQ